MRGNGKVQKKKLSADETATLLTHVRELQIRLLVTAVVLVGAGVVAYLYYGNILDILRKPLNAPLYYNSVSGSFAFVMKICLVAGIAVSVPLIVYNFIMFVRPAFIQVFTLKRVFLMTVGSVLAAAGGAVFGFLFIIPGALHFFSGFQVHGLHELISADSYLNFVINVLITFILMFQLPLIVSLIDRLVPISPRAMWKGEKWALVGSIVIALIVPFAMDLMTQVMIALPIFILYNLSFVVIAFQHSYGRKVAKKKARIALKTEKKAEKLAGRQAGKHGRKQPAPALAAAPASLAPHPQLAEVFALQASSSAPNAKKLHATAQPASRPVVRPVQSTFKPVQKAPVMMNDFAPIVNRAPMPRMAVSMDGMTRTAPAAPRMQPTSVIRQAGAITPPARPMAQRSMNLMSDIR